MLLTFLHSHTFYTLFTRIFDNLGIGAFVSHIHSHTYTHTHTLTHIHSQNAHLARAVNVNFDNTLV
jgi:hypothetical protein